MAKYIEKVPPPAEVDIEFYDSKKGHIAVAPLGFKHHEDERIVGTMLEGHDKQCVNVHEGDAIITYPGNVVFRKPACDVSAFYEKPAAPPVPALPDNIPEVDIDDLLEGTDK